MRPSWSRAPRQWQARVSSGQPARNGPFTDAKGRCRIRAAGTGVNGGKHTFTEIT